MGVIRHELGGREAGGTGSKADGGRGPINGHPESGVSGCTPYNSRMDHVVEAETTATGEVGDVEDLSSSSGGTLVRVVMGDLADSPVLGGEKTIGEGCDCEESVLPSQILDNRILKSIPKSRPECSKIGSGRNG